LTQADLRHWIRRDHREYSEWSDRPYPAKHWSRPLLHRLRACDAALAGGRRRCSGARFARARATGYADDGGVLFAQVHR
jgi:hypothetical protein